jgi:hypothetical protein
MLWHQNPAWERKRIGFSEADEKRKCNFLFKLYGRCPKKELKVTMNFLASDCEQRLQLFAGGKSISFVSLATAPRSFLFHLALAAQLFKLSE